MHTQRFLVSYFGVVHLEHIHLLCVQVFLTVEFQKLNLFVSSSRVLVRRARKLAQQYFLVYQEPIPTGQLVQRVASVMQEYTQSGWVYTR